MENENKTDQIKDVDAVLSAMKSDNNELIKHVSKLYLPIGCKVADVTYGKGAFWRHLDMSKYDFYPSDLIGRPNSPPNLKNYDFTNLPYDANSFDVVVFDPPYVHNPGNLIVDKNYQNSATTKGFYHVDIIELYRKGMVQAKRVLKEHGTLWVKCKDEIESSLQRWSHIEIYDLAQQMGFYAKDLFVMMQKQDPIVQHKKQQHARKNHSYLWIFQKPELKDIKNIVKISPKFMIENQHL